VASDAIEAFMLLDQGVSQRFVTSDFSLFDKTITWIEQNHLLSGHCFCEFGAGFGVCAMLAALHGMDSVGIEVEADLVEQASELAERLDNKAAFYCGSFVQRGSESFLVEVSEGGTLNMDEQGVHEVVGRDINDFDLIFAYPWPVEYAFFESMFDEFAADGTLMLTYRGLEGMSLVRKV
jgi:hypothetical protein